MAQPFYARMDRIDLTTDETDETDRKLSDHRSPPLFIRFIGFIRGFLLLRAILVKLG